MSILVKGMEMPCACVDCELYEADLYWCLGAKKEVPYSPVDKRAEFCPLVEVPTPHGRLIDADAFDRHMKQTPRYFSMCCDLEEQPAIIEAEEEP